MGWCWTTVGEIGDVQLGRQRSPKNRSDKYPTKYVRAANITWNGLSLDDVMDMDFKPSERATYTLQPGDILLSEASGSADEVWKPAIWNGEIPDCCFQNTVIRFRPRGLPSDFPFVVFCHFARNKVFAQVAKGIGIHHLGGDRFSQMPFPLPPAAEQPRIKAKVDELFSDLDSGVAALERVKAKLKRYRAAVLKAAVEGRLTEEWRKKNRPKETGQQLLDRILRQRRRKWEEDQLAAFAKAGKTPPAKWKEKYKEPAGVDATNLPPLPEGWCWASVEQVGDVQLGRQRSPKNRSKDYPTKYIRAANITEQGLDLSDVLDMEFTPDAMKSYRLMAGDIILSEASGSPDQVGKPAVWEEEIPDCCFQNTVIRLRPYILGSKYLLTVFRHSYWNKVFAKVAGGVGINHLSAAKFSRLVVPIPPLSEQQQIVEEVERRFSIMEESQAQINANLTRSTRLRQAILQRAFEGKLVPQDPSDEPASALLERIKRQGALVASATRSRKNAPKKART